MSELTDIRQFNAQLTELTMTALRSTLRDGTPPSYVAAALLRACYAVIVGMEMDPNYIMTELPGIVDEINTYLQSPLH